MTEGTGIDWGGTAILLAIAGAYRGWKRLVEEETPEMQMLYRGLGLYLLGFGMYYAWQTAHAFSQVLYAICMPIGAAKAGEMAATALRFVIGWVGTELLARKPPK